VIRRTSVNLKLPNGFYVYVTFIPMHRRYRGGRVYARTSDWLAYCSGGEFEAHGRTRREALAKLMAKTGGVRI
jgi:hypothetical protein